MVSLANDNSSCRRCTNAQALQLSQPSLALPSIRSQDTCTMRARRLIPVDVTCRRVSARHPPLLLVIPHKAGDSFCFLHKHVNIIPRAIEAYYWDHLGNSIIFPLFSHISLQSYNITTKNLNHYTKTAVARGKSQQPCMHVENTLSSLRYIVRGLSCSRACALSLHRSRPSPWLII